MKRDLKKARHVLLLVEVYANATGIGYKELVAKYVESGSDSEPPLSREEAVYLIGLLVGKEYLTNPSGAVSMTWEGHDWLDRNRQVNF